MKFFSKFNKKNSKNVPFNIMDFFVFRFFIKIFSFINASLLKISTEEIKIYDIIGDEEYIKEINLYKKFKAYYNKKHFVYTLTDPKSSGYSLSDIGEAFYQVKKRKALLILAEEKKDTYEFYFINTGNPFGKDPSKDVFYKNELGHLILQKNEFLENDKRLEFAFMFYFYVIEHKEIYVISNKKLDIFRNIEDKINYLPKNEIYEILFRVKFLEPSYKKLLKFIILMVSILGILYYGYEYGDKQLKVYLDVHSKKERGFQSMLSEQEEKTKKVIEKKNQIEREIKDGKELYEGNGENLWLVNKE